MTAATTAALTTTLTATSASPKRLDSQPAGGAARETSAIGPALDAQALDELRALDPGGANRLLERVLLVYRVSLARLLEQLQVARDGGDNAAIRMAAHTLKSSSSCIGAHRLAAVCGAAELTACGDRLSAQPGLPGLLDSLVNEAADVDQAVQDLLNPVPAPRHQ